MTRPLLLAFAVLAPAIAAPAAGRAATIETSLSAWTAARGGAPFLTTSVIDPTVGFLNDGTVPVSSFRLADAVGVSLAGPSDDVYISGFQGPQYSDGYAGQLVDSTTGTDTLTFSAPLSAFALTVTPDDPTLPATADTLTVTLSDGTSQQVSAVFGNANAAQPAARIGQFIGYTGAPVTSVTISTASGNDFFYGEFETPVPEPATAGLLAAGLAGLGIVVRRRAAR